MATAGNAFDRDLFSKLVLLMDSPNEFERKRAEGRAVEMCMARGVRFGDMVAVVFGTNGKRLAEIEAQLEQATRGGDELADELRRVEGVIETMRRIIAGLVGGAILAGWFYKFPPQHVTHEWTGYGLLVAAMPFVFLVCRWAVIQFKRRNRWVTWRNNDVFRALGRWWNGIVRKFLIEV